MRYLSCGGCSGSPSWCGLTTLVAFGLFRLGVPSQLADGQIDAQLGPGEPASWQYVHYLLRLLHGNLGGSITVGLPVDTVLARALPPTLSLMIGGILLWLIIGITAGLVSALRAGSWIDKLLTGATLTTTIVPTFVVALLLLALFSWTARSGILWLEPGYVPLTHNPGAWFGRMILPWIAVAATQVGVTARLTRDSVLGVLGEDYIRTAYAKGLPPRRVIWIHILRPVAGHRLAEHQHRPRHAARGRGHRRPGVRARRGRAGAADRRSSTTT